MIHSKRYSVKVGMLVVAGLSLFIIAIYYLGSKQNLFTPKITVKSYLYDAAGLVEGNKIRYAGVNVGTVSDVRIVSDTSVLVSMSIDQKARDFIRKNSKVEIGQEGLMGSKILLIGAGSIEARVIEEGDILPSIRSLTIDDLLYESKALIENTRMVSGNLLSISRKLNSGEGDFARLLNENTITRKVDEISRQLIFVAQNANQVIDKINRGEGDLGKLMNDTLISTSLTGVLANLDQISLQADSLMQELRQFSDQLNSEQGLIHHLLNDSMMVFQIDTSLLNLNEGVEEVIKTAESIRESWILNIFSGKKKRKNLKK